jgi:hypothetical protein
MKKNTHLLIPKKGHKKLSGRSDLNKGGEVKVEEAIKRVTSLMGMNNIPLIY